MSLICLNRYAHICGLPMIDSNAAALERRNGGAETPRSDPVKRLAVRAGLIVPGSDGSFIKAVGGDDGPGGQP